MPASRQPDAFDFDLFISYAAADNNPMQGTGPWVSQFVTRLKSTLSLRSGTEVRVWFDWSTHGASQEGIERALKSSALLVTILSQAYLESEQCLRELNTFVQLAGTDRTIRVVKSPVDATSPALLGYEFYRIGEHGVEELVDQPYWAVLNQLTSQVRLLLANFKKLTPAGASRERRMEVFLCHSSGDKAAVRTLWLKLREDGFAPWLDEKELLPGQRWEIEIQNAIDRAGAIVVCLSSGSVNKEGYLQREIKQVLDKATEMPEDSIFLIPARLEECAVPRRLNQLQWVDLFHETGYERLLQALGMRARQVLNR